MRKAPNGRILNPVFDIPFKTEKLGVPKRRDIQGLRAWAIILVLLFHYFPDYFPNGYVGVDMFFVISGYLIGMIVCKFETLDLHALRIFYYRRVKRIFPLYYLVIPLIFILMYMFLPDPFFDINTPSGLRAITLTTNLKSELDPEQDYEKLLADAEDLFTHTWSLCVEIQWYLLVPLIFIIQRRLPIAPMHFFIGVGMSSLIYYLISNDMVAFNSVFARIWQFCAGVSAFVQRKFGSHMVYSNNSINTETRPLHDGTISQKDDKLVHHSSNSILLYIAYALFTLTLIAFSWSKTNPFHLRVEVTFLTAILIIIGDYHEIWVLSNWLMNFIGDISYSLYLVHWPIYITIKYFYAENLIALMSGIGLSFFFATLIYFFYELPYLKFSTRKIWLLIGILMVLSLVLSQPRLVTNQIDYERKFGVYDLNLTAGDPSKNLSVAIQLNYIEGIKKAGENLDIKNCTHIEFENSEVKEPYGLCKMTGEHKGKLKFLVMGNSYACNQGRLIYEVFQNLSMEFHTFCLAACEPLMEKQLGLCHLLIDFHKVYNKIKPDVLFILHRVLGGKKNYTEGIPIEEDDIYQQHIRTLSWYLKQDKLLKVYIQHALPRCQPPCTHHVNKWIIDENKPLRMAGNKFMINDVEHERKRFEKLVKIDKCKNKCELFDYWPELTNKKGDYSVFDEVTNLVYYDNSQHLTKFGRDKVRVVFERLAEKFKKEHPKLV